MQCLSDSFTDCLECYVYVCLLTLGMITQKCSQKEKYTISNNLNLNLFLDKTISLIFKSMGWNLCSYDGHSPYQHWCLIICFHQSWFIWYQPLPSVLLGHHACYSLFLQTATVCPQHTCTILLHQTDTALTTHRYRRYRLLTRFCRRDKN